MRSVVTGVILVALAFVMMLLGLSMAAGIVIGAALLSPAKAHGDAAWIAASPRYVDATGAHCCGVSDCNRRRPSISARRRRASMSASVPAMKF